ncbi:unnamed protein product [Sphagnum jensenii]|uniref:Uncharacterized protein n=1 Tax=Sphagnum jensenii TaxID=128206 RepID=A0ABP1B0T9_9BRYO
MSMPQTRPPFLLPFPSLPSLLLYSLALSSLSLELWRFPSRVLIAALLLLLLLLLLSADLHFSPTQREDMTEFEDSSWIRISIRHLRITTLRDGALI